MRHITIIVVAFALYSCNSLRSGSRGITETEIVTYTQSVNEYDLEISNESIVYTIDISTTEGKLKLKGLNLSQAEQLALEEAAIKNNAARIVSPKFTHLKKGRQILRVTVYGFPARYKNK